ITIVSGASESREEGHAAPSDRRRVHGGGPGTLSVMIVRAVVDPPIMPDIAARETFLLQHVGIGLAGGLALQLAYRLHGLPSYPRSLLWGAGGFAAAVLAPLWCQPAQPPGGLATDAGGARPCGVCAVAVPAA